MVSIFNFVLSRNRREFLFERKWTVGSFEIFVWDSESESASEHLLNTTSVDTRIHLNHLRVMRMRMRPFDKSDRSGIEILIITFLNIIIK